MGLVVRPSRYITIDEVRLAAGRVLARSKDATLWSGAGPFPVEIVAETIFGLRLDWQPIPARGSNNVILAALWLEERCILLNELTRELFDRTRGLLRFTLGHELGHMSLHVEERSEDVDPRGMLLCGQSDARRRERQADSFAAELLMPSDLLMERASGRRTELWPVLYGLRDRFGVSASAMRNRLRDLGFAIPPDVAPVVRRTIRP